MRRIEKSNGFTLSFYSSYFGDFGRKYRWTLKTLLAVMLSKKNG